MGVFCKYHLEKGNLSEEEFGIFKGFQSDLQQQSLLPTHYVLLEARPEVCMHRIQERNRSFEQKLWLGPEDIGLMNKFIQDAYKKVEDRFDRKLPGGAKVIRIDANRTEAEICADFVKEMEDVWCEVSAIP